MQSSIEPSTLGHDGSGSPSPTKKSRAKSEFWAVVRHQTPEGNEVKILREASKKLLERALEGYKADDVLWAFRGKIRQLQAQARVAL